MKTETIKIDPNGKYIILLEFDNEKNLTYEYVDRITEQLQAWWKSDSHFFVIYNNLKEGIKIRFKRVDNG